MAGDPDPTAQQVSARTTIQVLDGTTLVDEESGIGFTESTLPGARFVSDDVVLTDGTAPDPGNGVLDVRDGNSLRVLYADVGDFRGGLNEAGLGCTWFFIRNLGLGLAVDRKDVRIREYYDGDYIIRGSYSQFGVVAFLEAAF